MSRSSDIVALLLCIAIDSTRPFSNSSSPHQVISRDASVVLTLDQLDHNEFCPWFLHVC